MPGWEEKKEKFVQMQGRTEVGTVISTGVNVGNIFNVRVHQILIQATGEICMYAVDSLTYCNEDGSEIKSA